MRKLTLLLVFLAGLLIACQALANEADVRLEGTWAGAIEIPGTTLGISITFSVDSSGNQAGSIDIPLQQVKGMALGEVSFFDETVSFTLPEVPGDARFAGSFYPAADSIAGDFSQAGGTFPLWLKRQSAAAQAEQAAQQDSILAEIRAFADTVGQSWKVPGVAVAIVKDGEVILSEGFGYRNLTDSLPVTENTLFAIGSTTKAFTTMAMGMLVDDGLLEWDKPVRDYLPDFKLYDEYASEHLTPLDLVTHRSGLPRHDLMWYGSVFSRREIFQRLRYLQPSEEPRTTFQYNNLMFMTAGYLVGQLSGSTWEEVVGEQILEPLGMTGCNFSVNESKLQTDYALPYVEADDEAVEVPFREIDAVAPAGAINAGVADMVKWVKFHLEGGKVDEEQLISEGELSFIHTPHMTIEQPANDNDRLNLGYGLGWFLESYRGHFMSSHGGGIDGFTALVTLFPNDNLGIVSLANMSGTPLPNLVNLYAADLLLDLEPIDRHGQSLARISQAETMTEQNEEKKEAEQVKDTKPSHKLEEYCGDYEHPAYGVVTISLRDDKLYGELHGTGGTLEHWHYDVFKIAFDDIPGEQSMLVSFFSNSKGDIERLTCPLEPMVDEIEFARLPDSRLRDPEYLQRFLGEYELMGEQLTITMKGDGTLVITVPGQPPYDLEPYKGTEFVFRALDGYAVEFSMDDGKVEEMIIKQPNGVFTAKRVE